MAAGTATDDLVAELEQRLPHPLGAPGRIDAVVVGSSGGADRVAALIAEAAAV